MLRRFLGEQIELYWKPGAECWPVRMDPGQLDQILTNLLVNARDAIDDVGEIRIETRNRVIDDEEYVEEFPEVTTGEYAVLSVADTGGGMDADTMDRIFEPFFTTKKTGEGTGLGLASVHGIVRQHHGFIHVYSEPGSGTTFRIYLPRAESDDRSSAAELRKERTDTGVTRYDGATVLFVEDEPALLRLGKRLLERIGVEVLAAESPEAAIRLSEASGDVIHLLITDVVMPGMNGRELSEIIRGHRPDIECLFMSGYSADVIATRGIIERDVHFLEKPFSASELAGAITDALAD